MGVLGNRRALACTRHAPLPREVEAVDDLARTDEATGRLSVSPADEVQGPVDAVVDVDVAGAGRAEQRGVAVGAALEAVRTRVDGAMVGLHLGDTQRHPRVRDGEAQELRRDVDGRMGEER